MDAVYIEYEANCNYNYYMLYFSFLVGSVFFQGPNTPVAYDPCGSDASSILIAYPSSDYLGTNH